MSDTFISPQKRVFNQMTGTSASYLNSTMAGADESYLYSTTTSTAAYTLYD